MANGLKLLSLQQTGWEELRNRKVIPRQSSNNKTTHQEAALPRPMAVMGEHWTPTWPVTGPRTRPRSEAKRVACLESDFMTWLPADNH
jgi:hypothetical protein